MKTWLLWAGALGLPAALLITLAKSPKPEPPPPDPFPGEMFELSYDRFANTPKWVRLCEAKLEWRLKDLDWRKQNSQLSSEKPGIDDLMARIKAALDASRAGKRCELPVS